MKVAVIGSNGFIGKSLVQELSLQKQVQLFLFGKSVQATSNANWPYKKIDFDNEAELMADMKGMDVIYYLASETIPASSWNEPRVELEKNLKPFLNLLDVASNQNVKKIAFISSAGTVYGPTHGKVKETSHTQPFSPYGIIKLTMENFLSYYQTRFGMQFDVFRVSNVYGPGQNTGKGLGLINTFLEKIIRSEKVQVFGDGSNIRNYIYVNDVAKLLTLSINTLGTSGVYNISSNDTLSIKQVLDEIKTQVNETVYEEYKDGRGSDNSFIDLDNSKILKFFPQFSFTKLPQGIQQTYTHLKSLMDKK